MGRHITLTVNVRISRSILTAVLALAFLCWNPHILGSETLTLTTYYPSPYGGYARLLTTDQTILARDGGRVGVGNSSPGAKLDVTANSTTWGGWYEAIRLSQGAHSAITHPGGGLLFGMHGNRNFYWADTMAGSYRMILYNGGSLYVQSRIGAGVNPTEPLDVNGSGRIRTDLRVNRDLRVDRNLYVSGRILGMCRSISYGVNTNERCNWNERVFAAYGNGNCVNGMLFLGGSLQDRNRWRYTSTACDRGGTLLCCRIQ